MTGNAARVADTAPTKDSSSELSVRARLTPIAEYGLPCVLIAAMIGAWQIGVSLARVPNWLLPSPLDVAGPSSQIAISSARMLARLSWRQCLDTPLPVCSAYPSALPWMLGRSPARAYPPLIGSQAVPIIAIAPLLVIWFGYQIVPQVMVVTLICIFPMVVCTIDETLKC